MKSIQIALASILIVLLASCSGGGGNTGGTTTPAVERSSEQATFERHVGQEIKDYVMLIDRLNVPAEAQAKVQAAREAQATAQVRMDELKRVEPEVWDKTKVKVVIAVEQLRKAYAQAKASQTPALPAGAPTS